MEPHPRCRQEHHPRHRLDQRDHRLRVRSRSLQVRNHLRALPEQLHDVYGNDSVYTYTFEHEKRPDCPVCGGESRTLTFSIEAKVEELIEQLGEIADLQLKKPSLALAGKPLYFQAPKQLEEATRPNLEKKLCEVVKEGEEITVTDARLPFTLGVVVKFN